MHIWTQCVKTVTIYAYFHSYNVKYEMFYYICSGKPIDFFQ
jgi:glutaredoxin-related protein